MTTVPDFCWTCGETFAEPASLDAHQLATGHELDQPDHPLHHRQENAMNLKPINTPGGFRLHWRSFGYHFDPVQHQRVIGSHVYIFRTLPDRIDVWRSDMADEHHGYRWTLVHSLT